jgi:hypothetical protein
MDASWHGTAWHLWAFAFQSYSELSCVCSTIYRGKAKDVFVIEQSIYDHFGIVSSHDMYKLIHLSPTTLASSQPCVPIGIPTNYYNYQKTTPLPQPHPKHIQHPLKQEKNHSLSSPNNHIKRYPSVHTMYIRHPINTTRSTGSRHATRRDGSPTDCQNATFHDPAAPSNVGANGQGDRRRVLIWHEMGMVWDMSRDKVECEKSIA